MRAHEIAGGWRSPLPIRRRNASAARPGIVVLLGLLCALGAPASASAVEPEGTIQVAVTVGGSPPAKPVTVQVLKEAAGSFSLFASLTTEGAGKQEAKVPAGNYKLKFLPTDPAYAFQFNGGVATLTQAAAVPVAAKASVPVKAELAKGAVITGTVTDASTHKPVANAAVSASNVGEPGVVLESPATTNASGQYELKQLPAATYDLAFAANGYLPRKLSGLTLAAGETLAGENTALTPVAPLDATPPVASGTPAVGQPLSCAEGQWTGEAPISYTYQWLRDGSPITGATGSTYVVQFADHAHELACTVAAKNAAGSAQATSNAIAVPSAVLPVDTIPPVATGTGTVGQPLSCSEGTWMGEVPISYTYQWLRDGSPITGATGSAYVVQSADQGHQLSCEVTATDEAGMGSAVSNAIGVPSPPVVVVSSTSTSSATSTTPPAKATPMPPVPPAPKATIALSTVSIFSTGRSAPVRVACSVARCTGTVELLEQLLQRVRRGHRVVSRQQTLILAKGSFVLAAGRHGIVVLHLTRSGVRLLAMAVNHQVPALLSSSLVGGTVLSRAVIFSRRR